jgi:3-hydroxybutyryl-CoA dehydratase
MNTYLEAFASMATYPFLMSRATFDFLRIQCEQAEAVWQLWNSYMGGTWLRNGSEPAKDTALFVGKSLSKTKTLSDLHTMCFGLLSLDFNPLHFNETLARRTRFEGRIVHGLHSASLFTGVLAELTPWCVYLHQDMDFMAPVRHGDVLTATGTIEEIGPKGVVQVALVCRNQNNVVVVRGRALVKQLQEIYGARPTTPEAVRS